MLAHRPLLCAPHVHVEPLEFDGTHERLRMCAMAGGRVSSWLSRRVQEPEARRVDFQQVSPKDPEDVMMSCSWIVEERPGGSDRPLGPPRSGRGPRPPEKSGAARHSRWPAGQRPRPCRPYGHVRGPRRARPGRISRTRARP
ncbi:hypothetical protein [Streptomyces hypolithicus]